MKSDVIKVDVDLYMVLKNLLNVGTLSVTFTKKDGTERTMKCTTKSSHIPEEKQPIGEKIIKENNEIIRAYDVESEGWRSFRVENVMSFDILK